LTVSDRQDGRLDPKDQFPILVLFLSGAMNANRKFKLLETQMLRGIHHGRDQGIAAQPFAIRSPACFHHPSFFTTSALNPQPPLTHGHPRL
jgi:hypothetical protein